MLLTILGLCFLCTVHGMDKSFELLLDGIYKIALRNLDKFVLTNITTTTRNFVIFPNSTRQITSLKGEGINVLVDLTSTTTIAPLPTPEVMDTTEMSATTSPAVSISAEKTDREPVTTTTTNNTSSSVIILGREPTDDDRGVGGAPQSTELPRGKTGQ